MSEAMEEQQDRERMREELFGVDSEGEEEAQEPQQQGEDSLEVADVNAEAQQAADPHEQQEFQEADEDGFEGQQHDQAGAYDQAQEEEPAEYEEDQAGYGEDEAVEEQDEDEISRLLQSRGRKKAYEKSFAQISNEVEMFLAGMDVAAEQDMDSNKLGQPALAKLRMLPQLHAKVAERRIHDVLMDAGILGCLKGWIEPMPGGHLPNSKVRSAVLHVLLDLMVDVTQPNRKEQLKRSGIGRAVLFLNKLPEETAANRRLAKQLVENWSRPIFEQYAEHQQDELQAEDDRRAARQQRKRKQKEQANAEAAAEAEGAITRKLKPGDPGFRWHAAVPQPARLDYLEQPDSKVASQQAAGTKAGGKPDRLGRKLKILNRKVQAGSGRAAKVSLEGRGMMI